MAIQERAIHCFDQKKSIAIGIVNIPNTKRSRAADIIISDIVPDKETGHIDCNMLIPDNQPHHSIILDKHGIMSLIQVLTDIYNSI